LRDQRARRHPVEPLLDGAPNGPEARQFLAGQLRAARQLDAHRIDLLVVYHHLIVEVWPGGPAGRADIADDVALLDALADAHARREAAHMGIGGGVLGIVPDADIL